LLRWLDLPRAQGDSDLIMAPVTTVGEEGGELKQLLGRLISARLQFERKRLLYVAVTRAKRTLHLSAAPKISATGAVQPRPSSLLAHLWPVAGASFAVADEGQASLDLEGAPLVRKIRRLRRERPARVLPETVATVRLPLERRALEALEFSWAGETLRHIGTVVHANFEAWASGQTLPGGSEIKAARGLYTQQLIRSGVLHEEIESATDTVLEALAGTLEDPRGRWMFEPSHREAASELALTGLAGGRLMSVSIDRSFIDEAGTRWVIDFKTSRHRGGDLETFLATELDRYRAQLENYRSLAQALGPEPVRAALYFPLLRVFRELP
jgi:ATP-dependent exoDNAse (exonuclease V) beta subunit